MTEYCGLFYGNFHVEHVCGRRRVFLERLDKNETKNEATNSTTDRIGVRELRPTNEDSCNEETAAREETTRQGSRSTPPLAPALTLRRHCAACSFPVNLSQVSLRPAARLTTILNRCASVSSRSLYRKACSSRYRNRWNGSTLTYVPLIPRFNSDQKFSQLFV